KPARAKTSSPSTPPAYPGQPARPPGSGPAGQVPAGSLRLDLCRHQGRGMTPDRPGIPPERVRRGRSGRCWKGPSCSGRTGLTRAVTAMAGARSSWRRRLLIAAALACAAGLAAWIGVLAVTLPWRYRAGGWSAAWVGFDGVLFLAFAATAWAAWRRRQVLILCLVGLCTLLCCGAWFDTTLDWGTPGFIDSLTLALVVELPLAVVAMIGARRLLRLTFGRLHALKGDSRPVPPFWKVPLFGDYSAGHG